MNIKWNAQKLFCCCSCYLIAGFLVNFDELVCLKYLFVEWIQGKKVVVDEQYQKQM